MRSLGRIPTTARGWIPYPRRFEAYERPTCESTHGNREPAALIVRAPGASCGGRRHPCAPAISAGRCLAAQSAVVPLGLGAHGLGGEGRPLLHGAAGPGA